MPNPDKPEIRNTKYEIRNKSKILMFKCSKQSVFPLVYEVVLMSFDPDKVGIV